MPIIVREEVDPRQDLNAGDEGNRRVELVFVTHSIREALYLSDRILVLSRGPATVLEEVVVPLPRPRNYGDPVLIRMEEELVNDVLKVWEPTAAEEP